ncbi:MAG TPA: septum formation initiator family protein [Gordonia sp. (in: high G+C Gram-positive bacteria)]|uniref:FtsB family cell division protein n=1 Tax=unclassified Gordonia (in: high G+C Gram-positive bacteria) TaxID=2657482 RepID=UPI000FA72ECA|nr:MULTISPECIES: septum formation initiator family protein [unclassified Gordonia (in: high G+C Gram-positive bacteria)]RUP35993.1 MAG: septum formation initiator family protein [Gordonia sp. (in: high G+C Gram-positive bacteria)]HNP55668.1 septum formation initiator family protein [Gordonia sp. (in: high G+C Gram-positive bacteria)]HRC52315.1 septum formation initiator family protein [Gordonia sp. (in: high G+C Gram-positive bacteria)]
MDDDGLPDSAFDDGETVVIDAVVDGDSADDDGDDVDAGVADSSRRSSPRRIGVDTARRGRAPARALAARWHRLNPRRAIVLAVVLGFVALTLAMPLRTFFTQRAELDQVRAANSAIERENAELTRKVNQQGDPAYVEAQARARLQYVRPGETAFVLEVPGRARAEQERRRAAERAANPWYANLWDSVATPPAK